MTLPPFDLQCLILQGNYEERHYFALAIVNGFLEFRFSMGGQPVVIRFADYLIFDKNHLSLTDRKLG